MLEQAKDSQISSDHQTKASKKKRRKEILRFNIPQERHLQLLSMFLAPKPSDLMKACYSSSHLRAATRDARILLTLVQMKAVEWKEVERRAFECAPPQPNFKLQPCEGQKRNFEFYHILKDSEGRDAMSEEIRYDLENGWP